MKSMIKKSLSIFISVLMLVTYIPSQVFAQVAEGDELYKLYTTYQLENLDDLQEMSSEISKLLRKTGPGKLERLEKAMEKYIDLYKGVGDVQAGFVNLINEEGAESIAKINLVAQEFQETQLSNFKEGINAISQKGFASDGPYSIIDQTESFLTRNVEELNKEMVRMRTALKGEISAADFIKTIPAEDIKPFFEFVVNKMDERFLKGIIIGPGDTIPSVIAKLYHIEQGLEQELIKAGSKIKFIPNMITKLKQLKTPAKQAAYIKEAQSKLSPSERELINRVYELMGDDDIIAALSKNMKEMSTLKASAKAGIGTTGAIVTAVFVMAIIVSINCENSNSFAFSVDTVTLMNKIKNGTANDFEQYAFYRKGGTLRFIEEHPLHFGAYLVSLNEHVSNIKNNDILEIKEYNSIGTEVSQQINNDIEYIMNEDISNKYEFQI